MPKAYAIILITLFFVMIAFYLSQGLRRSFISQAASELDHVSAGNSTVSENDIKDLPVPVQKYLRYVGVIGKPKVKNFYYLGNGQFKTGTDKGWAPAKAEQYSFIENPARIYYMKISMSGLPVFGLHVYKNATATMKIKVAGLFTVANAEGEKMNKAETVTFLNDMAILAPASLIDKRIEWETIEPLKVRAVFKNGDVRVTADLLFNEKGELINFISNDRFMTSTGNTYISTPWSTPIKDYKDYGGYKLASYGEAYWHLPDGDFCYGKLHLTEIKYNSEL